MKTMAQGSLRKKISICFIIFSVLIGVIVIVGFMYTNFARTQLDEQMLYEDRLISQQISLVQEHVNSCANTIIININDYFDHGEIPSASIQVPAYNVAVSRILENATALYPVVASVTVIYETRAFYSKINDGMPSVGTISDELLSELDEGGYTTKGTWVRDLDFQDGTVESPLHYVKMLKSIYRNRQIGYVLVMIDENTLYELYEKTYTDDTATDIYITDAEGYLLSSSDRTLISGTADTVRLPDNSNISDKMNNTVEYRNYSTVLDNGWSVISLVNLNEEILGFDELIFQIIILGIVLLAIFSIVILLAVGKIMKPMKYIAEFCLNFNISTPKRLPVTESNDEVGLLVSNFNTMVDKNVELFEKVEQDQLKQRHLELALFQNQIKPHFLYNTLDTIYCLSSMNESEASAKVTKLLAEYYRNVLNKGSEWIRIKDEIAALEKYLEIQVVRYSEILSFEISCDKDVEEIMIPKLTLQPIVENAIYHGIKPKKTMGIIKVFAYRDGKHVFIKVSDNGIGLSQQQFNRELSEGANDPINDGFGMRNAHERLRLFFDENSGLRLENSAGGTTISVDIYFDDKANGGQ